ncbi:MAG: hypothetical protein P4L67_04405 [Candidatus Pacebacteria bacterium]|nr:hypothetical protein [Candidatus Paceibacterota bacterium]
MSEERQLILINTEAQMYVKPHVARYLRIIEEIKQYQETGVWQHAVAERRVPNQAADVINVQDMADELVRMLEEQGG